MTRQAQRRFRNRGYSVCGRQTFVAKGFSGLPSSPQPMELRFLTKPPSETWAHPLNALPSRKGASICSGKGFLAHQGLLAPQTRPESPWHWGAGGACPCPTQTGIFQFSAEMALSSDPAPLGVEMWPVFEPRPLGERGTKGSGEEGKVVFRGHSSGSPQLPSLYMVRPLGSGSGP